ncbi:MAG: aminotransferase class V-fold PLP-dependent enzyme [Acidobacteriaceae bacterium]|nr:aminotransferase class V-fold PLP-dependent enzyme [Acidobacteriaceae bacterium]MBV9754834.1 aminotransferase class V-fold PLP-dependent enzyme [Hyphomicrobiales bacterium]
MSGRHFLQIPGPTSVPERVLRAISYPPIDHRGPEFQRLARAVLADIRPVFKTRSAVVIHTCSGTGALEAALANTLSPGDKVLMFETGHFATLWRNMARNLGLEPELIASDWRVGADPDAIEARLREDKQHFLKAVCIVHNETSTGCVSSVPAVRRAIDAAQHPALLIVDTVSSLAAIDFRHDEWGVDVAIAASQKGLMLPPGLALAAVSDKALRAMKSARLPRHYFDWGAMLQSNAQGFFPFTPSTNLLFGLKEALEMLHEQGLDNVFARHSRLAEATRRAVRAWALEVWCREPAHYSSALTAVAMPQGHSADQVRELALAHFDLSLGTGLSKLAGKTFRIAHLGDTNDLTILGALAGVEMALEMAQVPHRSGGVQAALAYLAGEALASLRPPGEEKARVRALRSQAN